MNEHRPRRKADHARKEDRAEEGLQDEKTAQDKQGHRGGAGELLEAGLDHRVGRAVAGRWGF
jgi:hypothetical protein